MINVALLSRWHVHADDYAGDVTENDALSIKLVWDEDPARGKQWADELGVPFEADLQAVFLNPEIDAVIVNTPTNMHKEVIITAAKHKKHIFTEKVLAFTVEDCEEIYQAVEANHVQLMVSLPRLTADYYMYAQHALDDGLLGQLTMIRCRLAHNGAVVPEGGNGGWLPERFFNPVQTGGGALIDLGAHPIYLTNRLAGTPQHLYARLAQTNGLPVDDHAVVMLEYASGALGVIETSFLSSGSPFQLELYGTDGTLLVEEGYVRVKSNHIGDGSWTEPKELNTLPMPLEQWAQAMTDGTQPTITRTDVINLTRVNKAAALSHKENRRVAVNEMLGE
jgi:predicted dehydrogenase